MAIILSFYLPGVTCGACTQSIDEKLAAHQGEIHLSKFSTDFINKSLVIYIEDDIDRDATVRSIISLLDEVGFDCEFIEDTRTGTPDTVQQPIPTIIGLSNHIDDSNLSNNDLMKNNPEELSTALAVKKSKKNKVQRYVIKGIIGLAAGALVMGLILSGIGIPVVAMVAGASALTLILGLDSYAVAVKQFFKEKTATMDTLFTFSTLTIVGLSIAHLFIPWLPFMPEAALMILGFRDIGAALKESSNKKLSQSVSFKDRAAKKVRRKVINTEHQDEWQEILADDLQPNNIIRVYAKQTIPVDGVCLSCDLVIYKTILTGSTDPNSISVGDIIYAGMVVPEDVEYIEMTVSASTKDSYLAKQDQHVTFAHSEKAPIETLASRILKYFVPTVIGLAAVSGIVVGLFFPPALAIQCAISVLASACPCALGLITPMAVKIGMSKGIEHGVHFRSGKTLQAATQSDTVVFDLNGTLTEGIPKVTDHCVYPGVDENLFFRYLALLEKTAKNPIGKAIYEYAASKVDSALFEVDIQASNCGIKAIIDEQEFLIGNSDYLKQEGIEVNLASYEIDSIEQVTYLVRNKQIIGCIKTKDPLKKDAKFVIDQLKVMNKKVRICTGAEKQVALHYAKLLGVKSKYVFYSADNTRVEKSKHSYVTKVLKDKKVSMIGDAGNDAVAVAASYFSIAVGSNSDQKTREEAGATIHNSSLLPVLSAFAISKQTTNGIKQNLVLNLSYNMSVILIAGGVLVAIGFVLNPGIGAALMVLQVGLILLNQARIKNQELPHIKKYEQQKQTLFTLPNNTKTKKIQDNPGVSYA